MNATARKLKIAMVAACPFPANHGSAASIREMSEALARLGHEIHVVTYPIREEIPLEAVRVHRVNKLFLKPGAVRIGPSANKLAYDLQLIFKLIDVIARHDIDVVHAHNYEAAMVGWLAKVLRRRPMIYNAVTNMRDELPTYNFIKPRKLSQALGRALDYVVPRSADVITVVSDDLGDYLAARGIPKDVIRTVPAGVNLEMFQHGNGAMIRERHGVVGMPVVMYTGAFERFQNVDYLLQAMPSVLKSNPHARLLLVGNVQNAANLQHYRDMVHRLDIDKSVIFADAVPLEELPHYLAAADVAVVPRTECPGHPVKLLNYMAAAKPIVSFRGAAKGLHHMHNGYVVEDHDCAALAQGIDFLLRHPDVAQSLGERARETVRGVFDWDTLARGIEVIYRQLSTGGLAVGQLIANPYLKSRYVLRYVDRRNGTSAPASSRRAGAQRRSHQVPIEHLERRQVAFPRLARTQHVVELARSEVAETPGQIAGNNAETL